MDDKLRMDQKIAEKLEALHKRHDTLIKLIQALEEYIERPSVTTEGAIRRRLRRKCSPRRATTTSRRIAA
jgi:hypothetical protein